ncbi:MAG: hypothetical protein H6640_18570 [Caldilineaceae bacterium]|nr:hypothetical protein [Caldilineaceae bacterium]
MLYSRSNGVFSFPKIAITSRGSLFSELASTIASGVELSENNTGEAPVITEWCLPDDIESFVVLHALSICRIRRRVQTSIYTLQLTYFAEKPGSRRSALCCRMGTRQRRPEFYPGGLQGPSTRPSAAKLYDLQVGDRRPPGYLDFTQEHLPLRIGAVDTIAELYQTIPGERRRYVWRNGQMVYYNR